MLILAMAVLAQERVAWINMELSGRAVTERVTNKAYDVQGALPPYCVDGASGRALRLDGYSHYAVAEVAADRLDTKVLTVALWMAPEAYPMMNVAEATGDVSIIAGNIDDAAKTGFAFTLGAQGDYGFDCYTDGWKWPIPSEPATPLQVPSVPPSSRGCP